MKEVSMEAFRQGGAGGLGQDFDLNGRRVIPRRNVIRGPMGERRVEPKAMAVLLCLVRHAGSVVTHDDLTAEVWGGAGATADLRSRAVGQLRRALGDGESGGRVIETVRGSGYCLLGQVRPASASSARPASVDHTVRLRMQQLRTSAIASGLTLAGVALWAVLACGL